MKERQTTPPPPLLLAAGSADSLSETFLSVEAESARYNFTSDVCVSKVTRGSSSSVGSEANTTSTPLLNAAPRWSAARSCAASSDLSWLEPAQQLSEQLLEPSARRRRAYSTNSLGAPLRPKKRKATGNFGAKAIGQKSSFVYLVNQIFGTGVIAIPRVFTLSGWLPCLIADVFVCLSAWLGTLMTLRCMTLVEGNQNFERRLEYMNLIRRYLRRPYYRLIQAFFYLSIFSSNVISIIVVAQSCDSIITRFFRLTPALFFAPTPRFGLVSDVSEVYGTSGTDAPVKEPLTFAITLGYLLTAAVCIPLSLETMDENMKVQYLSFGVLIATLLGLAVTSCLWSNHMGAAAVVFLSTTLLRRGSRGASRTGVLQALPSRPGSAPARVLHAAVPPAFGQMQYGELMSTFLASYSCVNVIPSWANEMSWDVDVNKVVAQGLIFSCLVYYLFGFCMVYSMPDIETDNVLQEVLDHGQGTEAVASLLVYAFDLVTVAPGILVYCITTRYNIMTEWAVGGESAAQTKAIHHKAVFWSSLFPFLLAWLVSDSSHFSALLSWSSLVFSLSVNFIAPLLIFLVACAVSPLSHKNPVLLTKKNNVQNCLLSLAGSIAAGVANPELLELPEPAEGGEEFYFDDAKTRVAPSVHYADELGLNSSYSRAGSNRIVGELTWGDDSLDAADEPQKFSPSNSICVSRDDQENPFLPLVCKFRGETTRFLPFNDGFSTHRALTPKPLRSFDLLSSHHRPTSSVYSRPPSPTNFMPRSCYLVPTKRPFAPCDSPVGSDYTCRLKRPRASVASSVITNPVKIARRFRWDTVQSRRRQMTVQVAKQKLENAIPVVKAMAQIAPLALKAKLGKNFLTPFKSGISPWSARRPLPGAHNEFVWASNSAFQLPSSGFGLRSERRCATYIRSQYPDYSHHQPYAFEPQTTKSAIEFSRHNTACVARPMISSFPHSSYTTSSEEASCGSGAEPSYGTFLPEAPTNTLPQHVAIVINSPMSPTPSLPAPVLAQHRPSGRPTRVTMLAAPSPVNSLSADELSLESSSSRSHHMPIASTSRRARQASAQRLGANPLSMSASCRTPSPLSVRFALSANVRSSDSSHSMFQVGTPPALYTRRRALKMTPNSSLEGCDEPQDAAEEIEMEAESCSETELISNAEDAYAQDEDFFGDLEKIRIRVFPKGFLRRNHVEFTVVVLVILVLSCSATALDKFVDLITNSG